MSRIKYASGPYGVVSSITYDSSGNRTAYGAATYSIWSNNNRLKKIGSSTVAYSSTGNMTSIGSQTWTYYKSNQMATSKPGTSTTNFYYDASGTRPLIKPNGHKLATLIYDPSGQSLLQETNDGKEWDYVYLDGMPVTDLEGTGGTFALHTDAIDTVQRASNQSEGIVWTGNYTPDGAVTPTVTGSFIMNLRLIGQHRDPDGDYHNGFRNRLPTSFPGYFEHDPIGLAGGPNGYVFAGNNPVTYTDLSGLDVTVRLYNGADFGVGEFAHIGIGVAPSDQIVPAGQTVGFYPAPGYSAAGGLLGTPGILRLDTGETLFNQAAPVMGNVAVPFVGSVPVLELGTVSNTLVIHTTPQQDQQIIDYLNNLRVNPGNYSLVGHGGAQQCAIATEHALQAGGISTPDTIIPSALMQSLQATYGRH